MEDQAFMFRCFVDSDQGDRKYMEDFVCTSEEHTSVAAGVQNYKRLAKSNAGYLAVFDGHGGPEAARFAQEHLLDEITRHAEFQSFDDVTVLKAIEAGFIGTSKMMWNALESWPLTAAGRPSTAGTTASIVLIRGHKLFIANVGDSTIVLGEKYINRRHCTARTLTTDHKPNDVKEKARIESDGGFVVEKARVHRVVWQRPSLHHKGPLRRSTYLENVPFLAVSRALGDLWSYNALRDTYIVSPKPDVSVIEYDSHHHRFLVIASDGLWNVVSPDLAVAVVDHLQTSGSCSSQAKSSVSPAAVLVELALHRWSQRCIPADNISVLVVMFDDAIEPSNNPKDSPCCAENINSCQMSPSRISAQQLSCQMSDTPVCKTADLSRYARSFVRTIFSKKHHHRKDSCVTQRLVESAPPRQTSSAAVSQNKKRRHFQIPVTSAQRMEYWSRRRPESIGAAFRSGQLQLGDTPVCAVPSASKIICHGFMQQESVSQSENANCPAESQSIDSIWSQNLSSVDSDSTAAMDSGVVFRAGYSRKQLFQPIENLA